jgi:hypothetical protein
VGWPSCATIHGAGCNSCGTYPHFTKKKSPLKYPARSRGGEPRGTQTDQADVNRLVLFVIVGLYEQSQLIDCTSVTSCRSRDWSRSTAIDLIAAVVKNTGSR